VILRVGLTGGIASGKSTVAKLLHELGCYVIDADQIVRSLYEPGAKGHRALVNEYGPSLLDDSGNINRAALSELALSTAEGAVRLNALIHPLVIEEQTKQLADLEAGGSDRIAVVEATLLIESGGRKRFDTIVVVDVPEEIQLQRAVRRGLSPDEARKRMARQLTRQKRIEVADYVIENSGDEDALRIAVAELHGRLMRELADKRVNERH
jgi:dephospho-CoA kinase